MEDANEEVLDVMKDNKEGFNPNYTLENILGFYYAITNKNYIKTKEEKDLLMSIIDVANSWG